MFGTTSKEKPWVAGVHQGVAKRRKIDGSHVGMRWGFGLSAGVSCNTQHLSHYKGWDLVPYRVIDELSSGNKHTKEFSLG